MSSDRLVFNPAPGWPKPPDGWTPPRGWLPDPSWPEPPPGWQLWLPSVVPDEGIPGDSAADVPQTVRLPATGSEVVDTVSDGDRRLLLLQAENRALKAQLDSISSAGEIVVLDDEWVLQDVGIYRYHHPLETAVAYRERLDDLSARIANLVSASGAIEMSNMFTFDNSLAKGRRMSNDLSKLMLRAYNAEVDNCLRTLRLGNAITAKKRVEASRTAIVRLGRMMEMRISDAYHALRLEEIELTADYLMKKQEEREAAREERARLREERKVEAELVAERERLDKERSHLINALDALKAMGSSDSELERRLSEVDNAIAQNDFRAANIRAGYVYIVSNRGAFGPGVVKIGLTRRLQPLERVNELSGASVPFRFDVHGLFFSEDAVSLESDLHQHFSERRVNHANSRKEFFFAAPAEVRDALISRIGSLLEFTERAEAVEYFQSRHYWPDQYRADR